MTSNYTSLSLSALTLLTWWNKLALFSTLYVTNLHCYLHLVNVVEGMTHLRGSFKTFNVCKLVVLQIEAYNRHGYLDVFLILLQHIGNCIGRWSFLGFIHNVPKIHGCQQHFDFEFPKLEISSFELVNNYNGLILKWCHCMLVKKTLTNIFGLQIIQSKLKYYHFNSKYAFVHQCTGNMPICFQINLLVFKLYIFTLHHSNHSSNLRFPHLKYLKLDFLHLKRGFKSL